MNRPAFECGPSSRRSPPQAERVSCPGILEFRQYPALRSQAKDLAVKPPDDSAPRVAEPCRIVYQRLQNWLQVESGETDDLQDFTRRRLLVQRLGRLCMGRCEGAILLLQLGEQSNILDGDHGLVGEGLEQGNLLRPEAARLTPGDAYYAECHPLSHHRHPDA